MEIKNKQIARLPYKNKKSMIDLLTINGEK